MRIQAVIIVIGISCISLSAETQIFIGVAPGLELSQYKESLLLGSVSAGAFPSLETTCRFVLPGAELDVGVGASGGIGHIYDRFPSLHASPDIDVSALLHLLDFSRTMALSIGIGASAGTRVLQSESFDDMHFYWHTRYDLSALAAFGWNRGESDRFRALGRISLLSLVSRPPESFETLYTTEWDPELILRELHKGMRFSLPNDSFRCGIRLEWNHAISSRLVLTLAYGGELWFSAKPAATIAERFVSIGWSYKVTK